MSEKEKGVEPLTPEMARAANKSVLPLVFDNGQPVDDVDSDIEPGVRAESPAVIYPGMDND